MATHDYSIANQSFPATRSDINNALSAIRSSNSNSTAPSGTGSTVAGELFYDTSANKLKIATDANGTFVDVALNSSGNLAVTGTLSVTSTSTFTGEISANGGIALGDSDKATFGAGDDLEIYHNGTDSYIDDTGTGDLFIRSNSVYLDKYTGERMIHALADGAVKLYHNGSTRLETTLEGVEITAYGTNDNLLITSDNSEGGSAPDLVLYRNSPSPANNDVIGLIEFRGENDADEAVSFAKLQTRIEDVADGTEDGLLQFFVMEGGTLTEQARVTYNGDFHAAGDVIAYSTAVSSDRKLKENIRNVENALDKIVQLNGVHFDWIKNGKASAGVIAQDVQKVLPEAVSTQENLNTKELYKSVNYSALSSIIIEAIKELKTETDDRYKKLEEINEQQNQKIQELSIINRRLKKEIAAEIKEMPIWKAMSKRVSNEDEG